MTQGDLLLLARTLAEARGVKLVTIGRWVTRGSNPQLFDRLAAGGTCSSRTRRRVGDWFCAHWPRHVEWPPSVPREEAIEARNRRRGVG
jgi:hypothetical protein